MSALALINGVLLSIISLFHFYWALGGKFGKDAVFPRLKGKQEGRTPGVLMTFVVAIVFGLMAYLSFGAGEIFGIHFPAQGLKYGLPVLAFIFCARAIGDLKYVGFFKKENTGNFAWYDSRVFSPLSLFVGIVFFILYLNIAGL